MCVRVSTYRVGYTVPTYRIAPSIYRRRSFCTVAGEPRTGTSHLGAVRYRSVHPDVPHGIHLSVHAGVPCFGFLRSRYRAVSSPRQHPVHGLEQAVYDRLRLGAACTAEMLRASVVDPASGFAALRHLTRVAGWRTRLRRAYLRVRLVAMQCVLYGVRREAHMRSESHGRGSTDGGDLGTRCADRILRHASRVLEGQALTSACSTVAHRDALPRVGSPIPCTYSAECATGCTVHITYGWCSVYTMVPE